MPCLDLCAITEPLPDFCAIFDEILDDTKGETFVCVKRNDFWN